MELRCAYCHDLLGEPRQTCGACGSHVHPDCGALLGGCPTLGCRNAASTSAGKPRAKPLESPGDAVSPAERRARMVLGLVLLLILVVGCCIPAARLAGGPFEWAAEEAELACEPTVAEAARRLIWERFPRGGPTGVGVSVPREALPPELRPLGAVYVTPTTLSSTSGGGFGTWGVLIALDPAADPPRSYVEHLYHLRKAGPGIWSWVSPG